MSKTNKVKDVRSSAKRRSTTVHAVQHAIHVLRCASQAPSGIGVSDLARTVGLHKSTVSRLVATLVAEHLLQRNADTDKIGPGLGLVALAAPLLSTADLLRAAQPQLTALAERSGETVNLSVWDGHHAVSVYQALGTNAITHYATPGQAIPAHCTASGKVLLAFASAQEIDSVLSVKLRRFTEHTTTSPGLLRAQLIEIRATGRAINFGEFASDVGAVAAVIRDIGGQALAAVTITVPTYRFSPERQSQLLAMAESTASFISAQLGYRPAPTANDRAPSLTDADTASRERTRRGSIRPRKGTMSRP